ncbi:MAG: hypothetical protein KDC73_11075 [Ignavibacteriae bacterium]|nr:hypothetical protein [Ignavibacteriota bacterium]MCB0725232.1 hypothetical protein [Ignavibacteriota bacterium]MCB9242444.1 hypothetical protein [Ignavibacteriales bacterium]
MWNSNGSQGQSTSTTESLKIKCNGNEIDATGLSGISLSEKIKQVARDYQIGKFDIYDACNRVINPSEIERGEFTGPLTIIRFNSAAA